MEWTLEWIVPALIGFVIGCFFGFGLCLVFAGRNLNYKQGKIDGRNDGRREMRHHLRIAMSYIPGQVWNSCVTEDERDELSVAAGYEDNEI